MRYVLDTSALLSHYRQEVGWQSVQSIFEDESAELFVASITFTEFVRRLAALGVDATEITLVWRDYALMFEVVNVDLEVASRAFALTQIADERIPLVDSLILAVAQFKNATCVHRDAHMRSVPQKIVAQLYLDDALV